MNTGRTALSLGCCGARAYLDILSPEIALYALPAAKLEAFTERVAALAKANGVLTQFHTLRRNAVGAIAQASGSLWARCSNLSSQDCSHQPFHRVRIGFNLHFESAVSNCL